MRTIENDNGESDHSTTHKERSTLMTQELLPDYDDPNPRGRLREIQRKLTFGIPPLTLGEERYLYFIATGERILQRYRCVKCDATGRRKNNARCKQCNGRGYRAEPAT